MPHKPKANGVEQVAVANGTMAPSPSRGSFSHLRSGASSVVFSAEQNSVEMTIVHARKRMITALVNVDDRFINEMSIEAFIDFLNKARLTSMPHRGSRWDKALRSAEYFALQISSYAEILDQFAPGSHSGVNVGLASCCLLLQLGQEQAQALEASFAVLYKIGLSLKFLIKHDCFMADFSIQHELQDAFCTLLSLVSEMAVVYRTKLSTMSRKTATIDFTSVFGRSIDQFHRQKEEIADAMWNFALKQEQVESSMHISAIRQWLEPGDNVLKLLSSDTFAVKTSRAEFTCEWFQSHLLDFFRSSSQTFAITGPTGSGKTVLAGWVEERLQRQLARKSFETIEYRFESDLTTESTSLACVKSLLLQLLQQNVGNAKFFSKLVSAHNAYISSGNTVELEKSLWHALGLGLEGYEDGPSHLMVIVDGIEKISGGDAAARELAKRIHELAEGYTYVRAVILSRSEYTNNLHHVKEMRLAPAQTHDDIRRMVEEVLSKSHHFRELSGDKRAKIQDHIVDGANGSFLWAELVAKSMIREDSSKGLLQVVDEAPKDLQELFDRLMTKVHLKQPEVKRLLGWVLVARRPLTLSELSDLLRVDLQHNIVSDKKSDIHRFIRDCFGLLLVVQSHSVVRFRHSALRQYLSLLIKRGLLPSLPEAQNDLLLRMLLYSKNCFQESSPSFEALPIKEIDETCRRHSLLAYSLTYWVAHFRETSMYHGKTFELSPEFRKVFPSSVQIVLCEWSRWNASLTIRGSQESHNLCLRLRKDVFGEKHVMVLQTLLVLGNIFHECHHFGEAINVIFQASQNAIETKHHSFALKCSTMFLTWTELTSDITRTDIIIRRESILKYVVAEYRHEEESELVIRYMKLLIQLYTQIQEEESAKRVYQELRAFVVKFYGRHSDELAEIDRIKIVLRKDVKEQDVTSWEGGSIFEIVEDHFEEIDITQIEIIIRKAESFETRGEIFLAEEILVGLWRRMVELCRTEVSVDHHISKLDCTIAYVRFLQRIDRHEQATAILICLWEEYKSTTLKSELLVIRLKVVGELMRSFGLLSVAISVFQKVWSWFKQTQKTTHEEAQSTTILISETIEQVTKQEIIKESRSETTTTKSTSTTTVTQESKVMIHELFQSHISSYKATKDRKTIVKYCNALVAVYCREEKWQEAISTITATLELVWGIVLTGIGLIALPEVCIDEAIVIAVRLAQCYVEEHRFEEAERIYIRIYQACIFSLRIEDEKVTNAVDRLIAFYELHHRHERTIEIYTDIISCYKRQLGVKHSRTIKMLYALGGLLRRHGYTRCYECYLEIVSALNQDSHACHSTAFEAAVVLMQYYQSEKRWVDTRNICESLWAAFVHHHHERKFELEIIKSIYTTYSSVLEVHMRADFMVQRKVALEYKETSFKYFGASSTIAIEASIAYASVCERHEKYEREAISIYEEVIKKTSSMTSIASTTVATSSSSSILQRVKTKLTKLYVKTITSSQTVSTTEVERAISLSVERYSETKKSSGCWHETTISHLHAVLVLYKKLDTKESQARIVTMLRELVYEIVAVERSSWRLYTASIAIANNFLELEMSGEGFELLKELHGLVMANGKALNGKPTAKLSHHHGKVTYIFLVAFELKLRRAVKIDHSEIMVNLITESMLFESFQRVVETKTAIEVVLLRGARLRQFLHTHQRHHQCEVVEKQIFEVFIHVCGTSIKTKTEVSFVFLKALLDECSKSTKDLSLTRAACVSGVNKVKSLLERRQFQEAYEVACCVYQFTSARDAYHDLSNVGWGFKLCQYLVGPMVSKLEDEKLRHHMTELSKTAVRHILDCCRDSGLNLVRLPEENLEELVALLGRQHNHWYLEFLLEQLWTSREAQKIWSQDLIIGTGRSLVNAKFTHGHKDQAIELCEDICYNLRRARGSTDPTTLVFYQLLAEMLTTTTRLEEALQVHKDVLKLIVDGEDHDDFDMDDAANDAALLPVVDRHVQRLRNACQRIGGWDNQEREIKILVDKVLARFKTIKIEAPEKWDLKKKPAEQIGLWHEPAIWTLHLGVQGSNRRHEPRKQMRRVMSNYGMNGVNGV